MTIPDVSLRTEQLTISPSGKLFNTNSYLTLLSDKTLICNNEVIKRIVMLPLCAHSQFQTDRTTPFSAAEGPGDFSAHICLLLCLAFCSLTSILPVKPVSPQIT